MTPLKSLKSELKQAIIQFSVKFKINLHEWVFQKSEIAGTASASAIPD